MLVASLLALTSRVSNPGGGGRLSEPEEPTLEEDGEFGAAMVGIGELGLSPESGEVEERWREEDFSSGGDPKSGVW